jgi:hypothetical protein
MPQSEPFQRVDWRRLPTDDGPPPSAANAAPRADASAAVMRWSVLPLSIVLCIVQVVFVVLAENTRQVYVNPTLISTLAFGVLMLLVVLVNPLLGALLGGRWLRPLNRQELVGIFAAMALTAGVSTFGLAAQLVPLVAAPWNPEWNTPQRNWDRTLLPHLQPALFIDVPARGSPQEREQALAAIRAFREGLQPLDAFGQPLASLHDDTPWQERVRYGWRVFVGVPWMTWLRPLACWMLFVIACYALFYSLSFVVLSNWSRREKLSFPLARLPESLLPAEGQAGRVPPLFRQASFWAAFALSALVLSWNGMADMGALGGLKSIQLGMTPARVAAMLEGSVLDGLAVGRFRLIFLIFFTAIGLAFLLPLEVSFSVWFYFLTAQAMLWVAIRAGIGGSGADFATDGLATNNFITAQAFGGITLFSALTLWRSSRDLTQQALRQPTWPARLRGAAPMLGLLLSVLAIVLWLRWCEVALPVTLLVTAFLVLLTAGLMRMVAETGLFWFQAHAGPFHFFNLMGLGRWLAPALMAPVLPIYSVLFLDLKTFLAPNLLNGMKMQGDASAGRGRFHLNLVLCLAVSVAVALGLSIFLAHLRGSQRMSPWFYSSSPPYVLDQAQRLAESPPQDVSVRTAWFAGGAGWIVLTTLLRRTLFWFPHPVGYLMLINPLISSLWFSFFIGWVFKKVVVVYGGKRTFDLVKPAFVGLIVGELITILIWTLLGVLMGFTHTLTLNRLGS